MHGPIRSWSKDWGASASLRATAALQRAQSVSQQADLERTSALVKKEVAPLVQLERDQLNARVAARELEAAQFEDAELIMTSMDLVAILQALTLLATANTMPLLAIGLCGAHVAWPLDGGSTFIDGRSVFGRSKTIRGVAISLLGTATVAPIIGLEARIGALSAAAAMLGDLLSSFGKRRLNLSPGTGSSTRIVISALVALANT